MNTVLKLLRNLWITFRPHFFFVSGAAGLAGMMIVYQNPPAWKTCAVFLVCFFSYGLIQALCDTFDLETDRINAPFRPMVTGELPVRTVWVVLTTMLLGVAILFFILNPLLLVVQAIALLFSFTYNRMKRIPYVGPLWNGVIVATLPLIGALGIAENASFRDLPIIVYVDSMVVGLVYAGFVLTGYFKDVTGDSQTGYRTAPVVYGIHRAKWQVLPYTLIAVLAIATVPLFGASVWNSSGNPGRILFLALGSVSLAFLIYSNVLLIRNPSERHSYRALLWYTRGMVLYFLVPITLLHPAIALGSSLVFVPAMEYFLAGTRTTGQA